MFAQLVSALFGIWLMAAPDVLGYAGPAAMSDHIVGPLVASVGLIAPWQVTRSLRWVNAALALWLLVAPGVFGYPGIALANSVVTGIIVGALSLVPGRIRHRLAGGWSALRAKPSAPA